MLGESWPKPMSGREINYLDEADLRAGIPHSEKIEQFPAAPFVGELGYADILQTLKVRYRFLSRGRYDATGESPGNRRLRRERSTVT